MLRMGCPFGPSSCQAYCARENWITSTWPTKLTRLLCAGNLKLHIKPGPAVGMFVNCKQGPLVVGFAKLWECALRASRMRATLGSLLFLPLRFFQLLSNFAFFATNVAQMALKER
jgi:hypothetical protein